MLFILGSLLFLIYRLYLDLSAIKVQALVESEILSTHCSFRV